MGHEILEGNEAAVGGPGCRYPLKQLWDSALASAGPHSARHQIPPPFPPMHQNSRVRAPSKVCDMKPLRYARKIPDARGLYLLVMPSGGRYWRYNYRFNGKHKTLALGVHPDIPLETARERHQIARSLLADGIGPSDRKRSEGKYAFAGGRGGTQAT
jgi:hypothetical protein